MIKIYVSSAFSKDHTGGNKAGVVLDHPELTDAEKMIISEELGYSETAFVTESEFADFKLEYFTPTEEVSLCGHATIATFATLKLLGKLNCNEYTIETKGGFFQIHVKDDGLVMMQQNQPQYYELLNDKEMAHCMGRNYAGARGTIQIISTGWKDIILPIKTITDLYRISPDFDKMTELSREKNVVGIHAFAIPEDTSEIDAVCRNFAPLYGINEESATGTASCALAGYFFKYLNKKNTYVFEQGYTMNLPSRIIVKVEYDKDQIERIYVGGYGYLVEERQIQIN